MNDEERRGLVARWMQGAGHRWLTTDHTPAAGSDLALDDTGPSKVGPIASFSITTAIDHLGSVVDAMLSGNPIRHYAHFTTLRTTLLASARARWILDPDVSAERQLRCLQVQFQNLVEQRKAFNGFAGAHFDAAAEQSRIAAIATLDAEKATLEKAATALGAPTLTAPKDTVSMLRDNLVDADTWEGSAVLAMWRTGSAAAHGYHWTETARADPRRFDEMSFNMALYAAWLFVTAAITLYDKRASAPGNVV